MRKISTADQFPVPARKKNYLNNDTRNVYSIEPYDSASQVGAAKARRANNLNRNQQAARRRGANQGVPRKVSDPYNPYDVPYENIQADVGRIQTKDEEVQSKDDIINKLADKLKTQPESEKVVRDLARDGTMCHYDTDVDDDTDIKIILGGFELEMLKRTLTEMESEGDSYSF